MKSFLFLIALMLGFFWAPQALASSEQIDNYQVEVNILEDSSIEVTETIDYNFSTNEKHGIYRDIPILKKSLAETPFDIYDIVVLDDSGVVYESDVSRQGSNINIKIGSADRYVTGLKRYIISYKVDGAFVFEEERDRLFWNAIGTGWSVPILKSSIKILLPKPLSREKIEIDYYSGFKGSVNKLAGKTLRERFSKIYEMSIKVPSLKAYQGATFNIYLDKGIIKQPPPPNITVAFLKKYGSGFLPVFTFLLMFYIWHHKGRDPKGRGNIIAQYSPPKDMMPAELGTIYDERVHNKDISAEIIYLAIEGYLRIRRIKEKHVFAKEDFVLEKLKKADDLPRQYQIDLMNNLFSGAKNTVELSSLKNNSSGWMKKIESDIYQLVTDKGYFDKNPQKTRKIYVLILGVALLALQLFIKKIIDFYEDVTYMSFIFLSVALSFMIIVIFGMKMPKRSIEGVLAKEYILGLKEYIDVAEKDRIKFHNAPAKDPQTFEELLPYAMAFGLEKEWAKQFEGIYIQEPDWYVSGQAANFSVINFGASLRGFRSSTSNATSTSSSGGGVGGGGGGSW